MSDDLFSFFGKGSKKFEPLDDDLDLPEVPRVGSPASNPDQGASSTEQAFAEDGLAEDGLPSELPGFGMPAEVNDASNPSPKSIDAVADSAPSSQSVPQAAAEPMVASAPVAASVEVQQPADVDSNQPLPGFGAGLFDEDIEDLDAAARLARETAMAAPEPGQPAAAVQETAQPTVQDISPIKDQPRKPAKATSQPSPVAESEAEQTSEAKPKRGHWDLIASVLGIGSKKETVTEAPSADSQTGTAQPKSAQPKTSERQAAKSLASNDTVKEASMKTDRAPVKSSKPTISEDDKALFGYGEDEGFLGFDRIEDPETETPLPEMFPAPTEPATAKASNLADDPFVDDEDPDQLIGWGSTSGKRMVDDVTPLVEDELDDDDELDDEDDLVAAGDDDEDEGEEFVEFEIEELLPSAKQKPASNRPPRRRRRPGRSDRSTRDVVDTVEDDNTSDRTSDRVTARSADDEQDEPRSRSRGRGRGRGRGGASESGDRKETSGRGRGRGRGRAPEKEEPDEAPFMEAQDTETDEVVSENPKRRRSRRKPRRDNESESSEVKSRGRGRGGRNDRFVEDKDPIDDELIEDVFDDGDEVEAVEEEPKRPRRRRRRGRGRSESRVERPTDDLDQDDDFDEDDDVVLEDEDTPARSRRGRGRDRGRGRERSGRDSRSSREPRTARDTRHDSEDRDEAPEKVVRVKVPTWDETIEGMIESNIKNHGSQSHRKGGGNKRGGGGRRKR